MKGLLLIISFIPTILIAQELPSIQANLPTEESQIWAEFGDEYDQILSFIRSSYWNTQKFYVIYCQTNEKWERVKWTLKLDDNKNITRAKARKLSFNKDKFQELLTFFDFKNCWTFELDSLNLQEEVSSINYLDKIRWNK